MQYRRRSSQPHVAAPALAALALATLTACLGIETKVTSPAPVPPAAAPAEIPADLLPDQLGGKIALRNAGERLAPQDLWKRINGAADLFLSYGFRQLLVGEYGRPGAAQPELEVSIYDMGEDLNALGVYTAEKSGDVELVPLGWEGYRSVDGVFFHKGPYYVKIADISRDGSLGAVSREAAQRIAERIVTPRRTIAELAAFPATNLVPGSIAYIQRDALGHAFLARVFKTEYAIGGRRVTLFFTRAGDPTALLAGFRDYGREFGKVEREWTEGPLQFLALRAFDKPEIVFAGDKVFGGVQGHPDEATALHLIQALLTNLKGL